MAASAPLRDAVNIPANELAARTHELPARSADAQRLLHIANFPPYGEQAAEWLRANGRGAALVDPTQMPLRPPQTPPRALRLWSPTQYLEQSLPQLAGRTALELACGVGRDACYLASAGWRVIAVDILPDALQRGAALAASHPQLQERITWQIADLEDGAAPPAFSPVDLLTCFRFLHRPLLPHMLTWIAPGGVLLLETFTVEHRARHGKPARAAHLLERGELPRLLRGRLEIVSYDEDCRSDGSHTARLQARRADAAAPGMSERR